jgi:hypothetical protein
MKAFKDSRIALENAIIKVLYRDNINRCTIHFDYGMLYDGHPKDSAGKMYVDVITFNPVTRATFLFCRFSGDDYTKALEKAKDYAIKYADDNTIYSYTVKWTYSKGKEKWLLLLG